MQHSPENREGKHATTGNGTIATDSLGPVGFRRVLSGPGLQQMPVGVWCFK